MSVMIPIYRAKKIDSDEYVEGHYSYDKAKDKHCIVSGVCLGDAYGLVKLYEIDPSTLSINFQDMLDSQGNKIFASLSKDGNGGDMLQKDELSGYSICSFRGLEIILSHDNWITCGIEKDYLSKLKIVGIKK